MIRNGSSKIKILKFFDKKNIGSLPRVFISSVLVIFFFYSAPILINFANKDLNSVQNNSKAVLAYTLSKKKNGIEDNDEILNENDLLRDIFTLNDLEVDTVRLTASTIKQLFEDTNYTLNDVRKKKIS